jgi:hypothetical protein
MEQRYGGNNQFRVHPAEISTGDALHVIEFYASRIAQTDGFCGVFALYGYGFAAHGTDGIKFLKFLYPGQRPLAFCDDSP